MTEDLIKRLLDRANELAVPFNTDSHAIDGASCLLMRHAADELEAQKRWYSTNKPRLEALQGLLETAQREAHAGREAVASLESERKANEALTNEVERLTAERDALRAEVGWHPVASMPRDRGSYLVANAPRGLVAPYVQGVIQNNVQFPASDWPYGVPITHWMRLPAAPKEG